MRVHVQTEAFELTPQLREYVESALFSTIGPFADRLQQILVRLRVNTSATDAAAASCSIVVNLYPSGEIGARAEHRRLDVAIARACEELRQAVAAEVSRTLSPSDPPRRGEAGHRAGVLEIVLDDNRIPQHLREWLERPENYLRPVRVRERWKVGAIDEGEVPKEAEAVCAD